MKIINEYIKLKKGETAIVLFQSENWDKYPISSMQIGINRFGDFFKKHKFGGYNNFEEAIQSIKKWNKFPPNYLIIKRHS